MSAFNEARNLAINFRAVLQSLVLKRVPDDAMAVSFTQVVLALIIGWGITIASITPWGEGIDGVDEYELVFLAGHAFASLAILSVAIFLIGSARKGASLIIGVYLSTPIVFGLFLLLGLLAERISPILMLVLATCTTLLPVALFVYARMEGRWFWRMACVAVFCAVCFGGEAAYQSRFPLESPFYTATPDVDDVMEADLDVELLYYEQAKMLANQTVSLRAGKPGEIEVFGLTVAGYAHQRVFLRETEAVGVLLENQYDSAGRMLRLANSATEPYRYPLANAPNIETALSSMASKMNDDEDIALIFLTSHGNKDRLSLRFWRAGVNDLDAAQFASILDGSGLKNVVLVISACYSGSFIDEIARPDRMIVTASSAEDTSFGCSDENDWTWWGRAYFDQALRQNPDFRTAFGTARDLVQRWEAEDGVSPSNPQVFVGEEISLQLDRYIAQRQRFAAAGD